MKEEFVKKSKTAKKTQSKPVKWFKKYFVLALILIFATTGVCVSFAWYTDAVRRSASVSFGAIDIDDNNNIFTQNLIIYNVVPNKQIASNVFFSKKVESRNMFVRLKMRYSLASTSTAIGLVPWIAGINATPITNLYSTGEYKWSSIQADGYYYLLINTVTNNMYKVINTDNVYFTQDLKFPSGNLQLLDSSGNPVQKGLDLKLEIIIEAIQSDALSGETVYSISQVQTYFGVIEKDVRFVDYLTGTGTQYINTGLETCNGLSSDIKFRASNYGLWAYGGRASMSEGFGLYVSTSTDIIYQDGIRYSSGNTGMTIVNQDVTVLHGTTSIKVNGNTIHTYAQTNYAGSAKVALFALITVSDPDYRIFNGRIYYAKFYVNGMIVLDLKPAVNKSTSLPCMFDTITGNCYYNVGTGTFGVPAV